MEVVLNLLAALVFGVEVVLNLLATLVTAWCAGRVNYVSNIGVCLMRR